MTYADSYLEVDLNAVVSNYRSLKERFSGKRCASVVKANAYGLGVEKVSAALAQAGCDTFFVANIEEGISLRKTLSAQCDIYIFHGVRKGQEQAFFEYELTPVLNTLEQLSLWKEFAVSQGRVLPAVIHVDTGMNRLGVSVQELTDCLPSSATIDGLSIKFLMSHLACADEPEHSLNTKQLAQMELVRERWPKLPLSFVNSYGVYLSENYHFDIARPGMALYGMNPMPYGKNPMCSVVSWMSSIVQVREIDTPQSVGYGATYQLDAGSVIATVPVGYADGLLRYLGNRGQCSIDGYKVPIVGRVSMDLITVDITALPKQNHKSGVAVEIMGEHQTVDELACSADTIGYEVLTRLGSRLEKRYKGGK